MRKIILKINFIYFVGSLVGSLVGPRVWGLPLLHIRILPLQVCEAVDRVRCKACLRFLQVMEDKDYYSLIR